MLSAHSREQLARQVAALADRCRREPTLGCGDIAYTLVVGREHFAHRFACVVRDRDELLQVLGEGLDGPHAFTGEATASGGTRHGEEALRRCGTPAHAEAPAAYRADLETLAGLYVQGTALDYAALFPREAHRRVPLPAYPFARESHWAQPTPPRRSPAPAAPAIPGRTLLGEASALPGEPGALSAPVTLSGDEPFLRDHVVRGRRILPGVVHLEMAREAAALALGADVSAPLRMRNVTWVRPLVADGAPTPVDVLVKLGRGRRCGLLGDHAGRGRHRVQPGDGHPLRHPAARAARPRGAAGELPDGRVRRAHR
ncbi:hypothetical protein GCM10020000_12210 [Streptomyces olivoverticillatus]